MTQVRTPPKQRNLRLGVAAIIHPSGDFSRVLITKRSGPPYKGYWHTPGGGVDFGESLPTALIREIREELEVRIAVETRSTTPVAITETVDERIGLHAVVLHYFATIAGGEPRCGDGTEDWMFATVEDIRRLEWFHPQSASALQQALGWSFPQHSRPWR